MATKKELEEQYKLAKDIIKGLQQEIKELKVNSGKEVDLSQMEHKAIGLFRNEDGKYKKVVIAYNPDENIAAIESIGPTAKNDQNYELALFEGKKFLMETIMKKIQETF